MFGVFSFLISSCIERFVQCNKILWLGCLRLQGNSLERISSNKQRGCFQTCEIEVCCIITRDQRLNSLPCVVNPWTPYKILLLFSAPLFSSISELLISSETNFSPRLEKKRWAACFCFVWEHTEVHFSQLYLSLIWCWSWWIMYCAKRSYRLTKFNRLPVNDWLAFSSRCQNTVTEASLGNVGNL